jgi:flagellar biosynthesis protein FlhG
MTSQRTLPVADQAQALRGLIRRLQTESPIPPADPLGSRRAFALAVTSGKGGVGKTNIALNLAIAIAQSGARTCLLDANLGLGNIDLLCGLNGYWNLSHVVTGARNVRDIVLDGPEGVQVVPGASGLSELADWPASAQLDVFRQLDQFEQSQDFLIIDTAAGIHRLAREFVDCCDYVLVVTTPEPTAIADAYASIKTLSTSNRPLLDVLVNQSESERQARLILERIQQTARSFLHADVSGAVSIPKDPAVTEAVAHRRPFLLSHPDSPASLAIQQLASNVRRLRESQTDRGPFFERMKRHHLGRTA